MTSRERFNKAMSNEAVDRAVFDLCGCPQTQIDYEKTREELTSYLGFSGPKQGCAPLDERVLRRFRIDTRVVGGMPTPKTIHNRQENGVVYDSYGIGHRMVNGHYEICVNPLKDASIDWMRAYPMPEAEDVDRARIIDWAEKARYLHERTDYAVVAEHPVLGVFELGCWMFGFDDYLYRLLAEPETVHAFSERVLNYQKAVIEIYYGALGRYIDCTTSGDDFGTQTGPFMGKATFDEMVKPYLTERIKQTRRFTGAFYQHHTCGSVHALIPSLAECGVDILNPIQPGTHMMEPERLRADFPRMCMWGGVDTQHLLPNASPEEVKAEVKRILAIMGAGGGYVLSPAHCIQQDVPVRNIAAIYDGAVEYYGGGEPALRMPPLAD